MVLIIGLITILVTMDHPVNVLPNLLEVGGRVIIKRKRYIRDFIIRSLLSVQGVLLGQS